MPAYDFRCPGCGAASTEYPSVAERDSLRCGVCERVLHRLFSPPRSRPVVLTSYQMRMKKRKDFVEVGDMTLDEVKAETTKYKKEAEVERTAKVGKATDEFVSELGETREAVLQELTRRTEPDPPAPGIGG